MTFFAQVYDHDVQMQVLLAFYISTKQRHFFINTFIFIQQILKNRLTYGHSKSDCVYVEPCVFVKNVLVNS